VAEGRDWAEGQVASEGQVAAKGHVVAKGRAEGHVVFKGHVISVDCVDDGFLYSLTKYSAMFAKMKGYFGRMISNNQRKRWSSCSLRMQNQVKFNNQLEPERRLVIEG
jgi:hypothetical protein